MPRRRAQPDVDHDAPDRPDRPPGPGRVDELRRPRPGGHEHRTGGDPRGVGQPDARRAVARPDDAGCRLPDEQSRAAPLGKPRHRPRRGPGRDRVAELEAAGGHVGGERRLEPARGRGVEERGPELGPGRREVGGHPAWTGRIETHEQEPGRLGGEGEPEVRVRGERAVVGHGLEVEVAQRAVEWVLDDPELRPDAPAPIPVRSTRVTTAPASARTAAAAVPTIPPPITTTSGTIDRLTLDTAGSIS